jgi:uncharacterized protein (DUF1330 family)
MAKGYWIAHIDVSDPEGYKAYVAASTAAIDAFGGHHIVRGGTAEQREGQLRSRHAVVEFPSYGQALACYQSEQYQQARAIRQAYSTCDLTIVDGYEVAR